MNDRRPGPSPATPLRVVLASCVLATTLVGGARAQTSDPTPAGPTHKPSLLERLRAVQRGEDPTKLITPPAPARAAAGQDETAPSRGVLDLLAPTRTSANKTTAGQRSVVDLLQIRGGYAGNALRGLRNDPNPTSPAVDALVELLNSPAALHAEESLGSPPDVQAYNTSRIPAWAERPGRDGRGRITELADASGNRMRFRWDENGFAGMEALARGPFNPDFTPAGSLRDHPSLGRMSGLPEGMGNPKGLDVFFTHQNHRPTHVTSPYLDFTQSKIGNNGKRSFMTYDAFGRPVSTWGSDGKLKLHHYGPTGVLLGTYDDKGRLMMLGHDGSGRHHSAFTEDARALTRQSGIGGVYLRGNDGSQVRSVAGFHGLQPAPQTPSPSTTPQR